MINPAELVDALVEKLRAIPELVAEMEGDPERIYAYHDLYPKRVSLPAATYEMPVPSILVAWQGTTPGSFGAGEAWRHNLLLYLRARETLEGDPPTAYYRLFDLIVNGVPAGGALKMLYATVHPRCHPMDLPSIQRASDEQGTDYFKVTMSFTDIEQIRPGGSALLDRMAVGCVVEDFTITIGSGPGRASSRIAVNFAGSGKLLEPSGITLPAPTLEHFLPSASAQVTINGVDYVTNRNLVSLELGFKNNLRLDSGFYPGSGTQDGAAIRGRLEFGDREASLKFTARFENGSSELTKLRNQTEGTAVVSLQGELISGTDYHSLAVTFHRVVFRSAVVGDTDGIVTVEVECQPLWHAANGLLTAVAKTTQDNIG